MAGLCQKRKFTEIRLNRHFSLKADIRQNFTNTNFEGLELIYGALFIGDKPKALGNKS